MEFIISCFKRRPINGIDKQWSIEGKTNRNFDIMKANFKGLSSNRHTLFKSESKH